MSERVQRLVFGEVAENYERARPEYPEAVIDTGVLVFNVQSLPDDAK